MKHYIYFTLSSLSKGVFYDTQPLFYIAVMALVSYAIRVLPLTLIRKPIKKSIYPVFLILCSIYYVIRHDFSCDHRSNTKSCCRCYRTRFGMIGAWFGASLFQVSVGCCTVVLILELNSCIEMFFCPFPCFSPFSLSFLFSHDILHIYIIIILICNHSRRYRIHGYNITIQGDKDSTNLIAYASDLSMFAMLFTDMQNGTRDYGNDRPIKSVEVAILSTIEQNPGDYRK